MDEVTRRVFERLAPPESNAITAEGIAFGLENPGEMDSSVFVALQTLGESMQRAAARAAGCTEGGDAELAEVERLLTLAPWKLNIDTGMLLNLRPTQSVVGFGVAATIRRLVSACGGRA